MADIKLDSKPVHKDHTGHLASLWRKIIFENKFNRVLGIFVSNYLTKSKALESDNDTIKRKNRSILLGNIVSPGMTMKTFEDLVFNLLGCVKMDISVKLHFKDGKESTHTITVTHPENIKEENEDEPKEENSTVAK